MLLQRVSVLRLPTPAEERHLCIVADCLAEVIAEPAEAAAQVPAPPEPAQQLLLERQATLDVNMLTPAGAPFSGNVAPLRWGLPALWQATAGLSGTPSGEADAAGVQHEHGRGGKRARINEDEDDSDLLAGLDDDFML